MSRSPHMRSSPVPPPPPYAQPTTTPTGKAHRPPSPDYATTIAQSALVPTSSVAAGGALAHSPMTPPSPHPHHQQHHHHHYAPASLSSPPMGPVSYAPAPAPSAFQSSSYAPTYGHYAPTAPGTSTYGGIPGVAGYAPPPPPQPTAAQVATAAPSSGYYDYGASPSYGAEYAPTVSAPPHPHGHHSSAHHYSHHHHHSAAYYSGITTSSAPGAAGLSSPPFGASPIAYGATPPSTSTSMQRHGSGGPSVASAADPFQFMRASDSQQQPPQILNASTPTGSSRLPRKGSDRSVPTTGQKASPLMSAPATAPHPTFAHTEAYTLGQSRAAPAAAGAFPYIQTNASFTSSLGGPAETISDTDSLHSGGSSLLSSVRDDLPLCPDDDGCHMINDKTHQRQFAHTCRLFPCYHGSLKFHARLFRHQPGQCLEPPGSSEGSPHSTALSDGGHDGTGGSGAGSGGAAGVGGGANISTRQRRRIRKSLKSVNFNYISPNAPNAVTIAVTCPKAKGDVTYDIAGDWTQVKLHSFKRYLHQVFNLPPVQQKLLLNYETELDDDLATVAELGVVEGSVIHIVVKDEEALQAKAAGTLGGEAALPSNGVGVTVPTNTSFASGVATAQTAVGTPKLIGSGSKNASFAGAGQQKASPSNGVVGGAPAKSSKICIDDL